MLILSAAITVAALYERPIYSNEMDIVLNKKTASSDKLDELEQFFKSIDGKVSGRGDRRLTVSFNILDGLFDALSKFAGGEEAIMSDIARTNVNIEQMLESIAGPMLILNHAIIMSALCS